MGFLIAAYLAAWGAVAAYLGWLAVQNRLLARRLDDLEATLRQTDDGVSDRCAA